MHVYVMQSKCLFHVFNNKYLEINSFYENWDLIMRIFLVSFLLSYVLLKINIMFICDELLFNWKKK